MLTKLLAPSPSKPGAVSTTRWIKLIAVLLLLTGMVSVGWELLALHGRVPFLLGPMTREPSVEIFTLVAPPLLSNTLTWLELDGAAKSDVPSDELLHLNFLQDACLAQNDSLLPWTYGAPGHSGRDSLLPDAEPRSSLSLLHRGDPRLLDELARCPDVDIYLPMSSRGPEGCASAMGPLKFLQSRLLPRWALDATLFDYTDRRSVNYMQLCPRTPMLFLQPEHALELAQSPRWPASKPVYLLAPELELAGAGMELTRAALALTDVVLCRTGRCDLDVKRYLLQQLLARPADVEGKHTHVLHTSQTGVDVASFARRLLGDETFAPQDFSALRFVHTTWDRSANATQQVLECWSSGSTELPPLDLFVLEPYDGRKKHAGWRHHEAFPGGSQGRKNVLEFAQAVGEAAFFLCPSAADDCLEMARAAGGVVLTADTGSASPLAASSVGIQADKLCEAVASLATGMGVEARRAMGAHARRQFHEDTKLFALRMLQLRAFAARGQRRLRLA